MSQFKEDYEMIMAFIAQFNRYLDGALTWLPDTEIARIASHDRPLYELFKKIPDAPYKDILWVAVKYSDAELAWRAIRSGQPVKYLFKAIITGELKFFAHHKLLYNTALHLLQEPQVWPHQWLDDFPFHNGLSYPNPNPTHSSVNIDDYCNPEHIKKVRQLGNPLEIEALNKMCFDQPMKESQQMAECVAHGGFWDAEYGLCKRYKHFEELCSPENIENVRLIGDVDRIEALDKLCFEDSAGSQEISECIANGGVWNESTSKCGAGVCPRSAEGQCNMQSASGSTKVSCNPSTVEKARAIGNQIFLDNCENQGYCEEYPEDCVDGSIDTFAEQWGQIKEEVGGPLQRPRPPMPNPFKEECEMAGGVWNNTENICWREETNLGPRPPRPDPFKEECEAAGGVWNDAENICWRGETNLGPRPPRPSKEGPKTCYEKCQERDRAIHDTCTKLNKEHMQKMKSVGCKTKCTHRSKHKTCKRKKASS